MVFQAVHANEVIISQPHVRPRRALGVIMGVIMVCEPREEGKIFQSCPNNVCTIMFGVDDEKAVLVGRGGVKKT